MADTYGQLLQATIDRLRELQARGVRYVRVSEGTLAALSQPRPCRVAGLPISPKAAASQAASQPLPTAPSATPLASTAPAAAVPALASGSANASPPREELLLLDLAGDKSPVGTPPLSLEARTAALVELRSRVLVCTKCPHLAAARKNVVFGVGSPMAELMFVGEAPGLEEDEQGEPFVGKAGQLLTRILQAMGFTREEVYIANILKCRPDTPGQATGNRKPTAEEMKTCLPYLHAQLDLIRPRVLVALGATAVEGLLGLTVGITKLRGQRQIWRGIPVMPTYHPAYLLRNQAISEKRKVWEDMLAVLEKLGRPITPKQRGYFLRP